MPGVSRRKVLAHPQKNASLMVQLNDKPHPWVGSLILFFAFILDVNTNYLCVVLPCLHEKMIAQTAGQYSLCEYEIHPEELFKSAVTASVSTQAAKKVSTNSDESCRLLRGFPSPSSSLCCNMPCFMQHQMPIHNTWHSRWAAYTFRAPSMTLKQQPCSATGRGCSYFSSKSQWVYVQLQEAW